MTELNYLIMFMCLSRKMFLCTWMNITETVPNTGLIFRTECTTTYYELISAFNRNRTLSCYLSHSFRWKIDGRLKVSLQHFNVAKPEDYLEVLQRYVTNYPSLPHFVEHMGVNPDYSSAY